MIDVDRAIADLDHRQSIDEKNWATVGTILDGLDEKILANHKTTEELVKGFDTLTSNIRNTNGAMLAFSIITGVAMILLDRRISRIEKSINNRKGD